MIHWKEEITIPNNIEKVWTLFYEENMHKIMPNVVSNIFVEKKEGVVGSKYKQTYREGKRTESYTVEILGYENTENRKLKQIGFVLANAFEINLTFLLEKIDENNTKFIYEGTNKGINFVGRTMLKLGGEKNNRKVVHGFLELVKQESLKLQ